MVYYLDCNRDTDSWATVLKMADEICGHERSYSDTWEASPDSAFYTGINRLVP